MAIRRFYAADLDVDSVELDNQQSEHARRVLRLGVGEHVELFDGWGNTAAGLISHTGRTLMVEVQEVTHHSRRVPTVDIAVAVPKGNRAESLIEKLVELDADGMIPLISRRSVVEAGSGKFKRFDRIAQEAAKQSHRNWMMEIYDNTEFSEVVAASDHDMKLIADTPENGFGDVVVGQPEGLGKANRILVLIGPEGGWVNEERQEAMNAGFVSWCFGPNVMRIETAAIAATAILKQSAAKKPEL